MFPMDLLSAQVSVARNIVKCYTDTGFSSSFFQTVLNEYTKVIQRFGNRLIEKISKNNQVISLE